jgi:signal transduction histidine kinase
MQASDALKDIRHALHELAQPLAAVTGLIDLLLIEHQPDNPLYEEIRIISDKLEEVLDIIAHIRDVAREASQRYGDEMPQRMSPPASEHA